MNIFQPVLNILKDPNVLNVALGTIVSTLVLDIVKGFTDDMVLPSVKPLIQSTGEKLNLKDLEVHVGFLHFHVGKFLQKLLEFLIILSVVAYLKGAFS